MGVCGKDSIPLKFCAPFKINIQKREELSNFKNRFLIFLLYPSKNSLRRKSKVCILDTQINYSGLRISHSKVFSSDQTFKQADGNTNLDYNFLYRRRGKFLKQNFSYFFSRKIFNIVPLNTIRKRMSLILIKRF